jgi:hypothetical protein
MARKAKQESEPVKNSAVTEDKKSENDKGPRIWQGPGNLMDRGRIIKPGDEIPSD